MTYDRLTADRFPGAPRVLPALLGDAQRELYYQIAAEPDAKPDELAKCYADVGQRLVAALRKEAASV